MVAIHPIHGYAIKPQQDLKTIKRNERERNRVETVNRGFETLRRHVPAAATVKKMSKVNILTEAVDYIMNLKLMLDQTSSEVMTSPNNPQQMSPWSHYHQVPQCHHHQFPQQHYHHPMSQVTPGSYSDHSGYYSDTSLQSPAIARSWTSTEVSKSSWSQDIIIKKEVPDSTTDNVDSSGDEEDVLDAIAEWQQI